VLKWPSGLLSREEMIYLKRTWIFEEVDRFTRNIAGRASHMILKPRSTDLDRTFVVMGMPSHACGT
jgi:hypothetical protein